MRDDTAYGPGGYVEMEAGRWTDPHGPLVRFPFPQLMSVNFDGCSLGDVATLAGLCRSAPVDSLVLPLARSAAPAVGGPFVPLYGDGRGRKGGANCAPQGCHFRPALF